MIKDLQATLNMKSDPYALTVTGSVEVFDPKATTSVSEAYPQGIDSATLILEVTASPAGGKGVFAPFHFEKRMAETLFQRVTVRFEADEETVEIKSLG